MSLYSRRGFIENALKSAAAVAASSAIPAATAMPLRRAGANERLRIATIGVKGRGLDHLNQWLKMADVEVAAICDIDENVIQGAVDKIQKFTGTGEHFKNFSDAIVAGKPDRLAADIEKGHLSSALCHLGNISYRMGGLHAMYKVRPFGENEDAADTFDRFKEHMKANDVQPDMTQITVGKTLAVDPKAETIIGDPEASKLLTREYRKPYVVPEKV